MLSELLLEKYGDFLPRQERKYAEQVKNAALQIERLRQDLVGSPEVPRADEKAALKPMQEPVKERIVKLREEIAQISEANRQYMGSGKKIPGSAGDHERRLQRLQEILDELVALTDWKKL